ncbi:hypothetical protein NC653_016934 [Populus alba x Populus x berolinensis]|uniref:Uncharacterized protein n=1 Tax=Populus alba x Populus x berolinensis TaxID=444605 RepID=A0AAD6QP22_9ROSI|nr:hypothetical protein NC653_016934 [Populus alba x Populus x berolinensis]
MKLRIKVIGLAAAGWVSKREASIMWPSCYTSILTHVVLHRDGHGGYEADQVIK